MGPSRILVVDDHIATVRGLEALLRREGASVACAIDGVAALDCAAYQRPDLVVADVQMPRMGGLELCSKLHAVDPSAPVILITGFKIDAAEAFDAGAVDLLDKPFEFETLTRSIERALETRRGRRDRERFFEEMEELWRQTEGQLPQRQIAKLQAVLALLRDAPIPAAVRSQAAVVWMLLDHVDRWAEGSREQLEEELARLEQRVLEAVRPG